MTDNIKRLPPPMPQAKIAAFDEIMAGLRKPAAESTEVHEIAMQLRALADTVWAGRDEWMVAAARKAQPAGVHPTVQAVALEAERVILTVPSMSDTPENVATRLWRDRVRVREQERDEAQARARVAEEKVKALTAEHDRLARQNARLNDQSTRLAIEVARLTAQNERLAADLAWLRAQLALAPASANLHQDMEAIRAELLSWLDQPGEARLH
jgi:hypothetical protein